MTHLRTFLSDCNAMRRSAGGTRETSYYTAVNNLLDAVGAQLKPKVRCVMQLKDLGAGNPDGGLFTQEQFDRRTSAVKDLASPARGVIEVKSPAEAVSDTATSAQVNKYWSRYKLVLVTNLRDWQLIGERHDKRVFLEGFTLADNETCFWNEIAAHPVKAQQLHGKAFQDFLQRVLQHNAPLGDPKDLAALLASYAREARYRVENASALAQKQLASLQSSLETSLGVRFNAAEGAHFFRSTLVQTLFYGVFSAWVLRHEDRTHANGSGPFDWKSAAHSLNVPMIAALFGQLSQPAKLKALHLTEVLDWTADALNRVDTVAFFKAFETTRSIQYFYEPFLAAFDPELRKKLGVWYTPEEIVRYQVARVDQVLQSELGLRDGLADPNVVVLDPCCGTGAYLVEVLHVIGERLKSQGADALAAHQIKEAALTRLFGFELLPAPYVVAHLQIGLLLRQWGAPLGTRADGSEERAGVYLTNALTGWEPPKEPKNAVLPFPEFDQERDAADHIKRDQKIIVILGNPPYDAFGGVALGEEQDLVAPYKVGLAKDWGVKKFNLDDLYVRFFRLAERRIAEKGGSRGVVSFISNFSWTTEPSFVVLRKRLLQSFDKLWIENMHGNRNISEYAPDGRSSETVFAQKGFSSGIRQGVVISTWVKNDQNSETAQVHYCDDFHHAKASERRQALLHSLDDPQREGRYTRAQPAAANKYSLKPGDITSDYAGWPSVKDLAGEAPINGLMEKRGGALIDIDRDRLEADMRLYFDKSVLLEQVIVKRVALGVAAAGYMPASTRTKLLAAEPYQSGNLVRYTTRPFDTRWAYYSGVNPLWNRPRPTLRTQQQAGNRFLACRPAGVAKPEGVPFMFTRCLGDNDALRGHAYYIPLHWHHAQTDAPAASDLFGPVASAKSTRANLSTIARAYLSALGLPDPDQDSATAELLWMHALAVGYSPAYLAANADGIAQDWPRIPLPATRDALLDSAALGREVAALLDTETPVPGVTSGSIRPALHSVAVVSRVGGGSLHAEEFALTAGWGSGGQGSVTMPGRGRLEARAPDATEQGVWGPAPLQDVYLNAHAYWKNVPQAVWDFTIGGYQVTKKWLSYREQRVLGRALTLTEVMEVTATARRLGALVLLKAQLDVNYHAAAAVTWQAPASA